MSGRVLLVVGREEVLGLAQEHLGAVALDVPPGLDQVEVRRRDQQILGALVRRSRRGPSCGPRRRTAADAAAWRSGSSLGVVGGPLVERDDPLPGRLDQLLAELDRLGQDDLFLGGQQGDLADLLEVHPDGIVDPDHVGRERLELLGGRLLELLGVELGRGVRRQRGGGGLALDRNVDRYVLLGRVDEALGRRPELEIRLEIVVVILVVDLDRLGHERGRPRLAGSLRSEPGLLDLGLRPARSGGEHRLDELLVQ